MSKTFPVAETAEPTPASPGPWTEHPALFENGAVYIEDANGELVGYATDTAGHTTENVSPDRRTPAQIRRNGRRMALAPEMLAVLAEIVATAPADLFRTTPFATAIARARAIVEADDSHALIAEQLARVDA